MGAATDSSLEITKLTQHLNLENDKVRDRHKTHIAQNQDLPSSSNKAKDKDLFGNLLNQNVKQNTQKKKSCAFS